MQINNFRGELTDNSVKKEALLAGSDFVSANTPVTPPWKSFIYTMQSK